MATTAADSTGAGASSGAGSGAGAGAAPAPAAADSLVVAVFQGQATDGDPAANAATAATQIAAAAAAGARIIVFPELYLTGYLFKDRHDDLRRLAVPVTDALLQQFGALAAKHSIMVCMPYPERQEAPGTGGSTYFNSVALFGVDGELVTNYRKTHLWDAEKLVFTPGGDEQLRAVPVPALNITVGILVCYDVEFPEPARELALKGADVLIIPTALARGRVSHLTPLCQVPSRAIENQVLVLYSNLVTPPSVAVEGTPQFCGLSAIIGIDGVELQRGSRDTEELLVARFPGRSTYKSHLARNPYFTDRRPAVYTALTELEH